MFVTFHEHLGPVVQSLERKSQTNCKHCELAITLK